MDTSGTRPFVEAVCVNYYVMRTPDAAMRTSLSHLYYPWQVFFEGDFNRRRQCYPRCPEHQVFPRPAANVSQWAVLPENVPEDPADEPDVLY